MPSVFPWNAVACSHFCIGHGGVRALVGWLGRVSERGVGSGWISQDSEAGFETDGSRLGWVMILNSDGDDE